MICTRRWSMVGRKWHQKGSHSHSYWWHRKLLRAGTIQQILALNEHTHRTVMIRPLERAEELRKHLLETPGVEDARMHDAAVEVDVEGGDAACCDLLANIVTAGFRVLEYRPRADLEQIFLSVTKGDVQ